MTREDFAAQCEHGASQTAALPVTSAILRWTAAELRRGEPPWWKALAKAWERRRFTAWNEAWSLFVACLHYEALSDADCPLVPYFPSCGGTAEAEPTLALARLLHAPPPSLLDNLRARQRRTFVAARAALWIPPAVLFFQKRRLPFYLAEVNAGAGLDLAADRLYPQKGFRTDLVEARVGLDAEPLQMEDIAHRRWLTAGTWPDDPQAVARLDEAADKAAALCREDAAFIQLAPCPAEKAPAFLAKNIPPEDEAGLLVFNAATTSRMDDAEYAAYSQAMARALKPWGSRALWVEAELVRGERYSSTCQLRAHRADGPVPDSRVLATIDLEGGGYQYNESASSFLEP